MRRLAVVFIMLMMALGARAQETLTFTTSGGLTVDVPLRYLVAEIAPLRVGITDRETGASLLFGIVSAEQSPDALVRGELRRLGITGEAVQPRALDARTSTAHIVGSRGARAAGTVLVASVEFPDALGLILMQPADSVPLPVVKGIVESVRLAPQAVELLYPACGSPELPQTITTSGGLSVCFPDGYAGEEKGPLTAGVADLARGVILSIYTGADLRTVMNADAADAAGAAATFAETLRPAGATVSEAAPEQYPLDNGAAVALDVTYTGVGSGRVIAVQSPDGVMLLSAVLVGTAPADIQSTLNAILSSATLGDPSEGLGTVRPADRVVNLGIVSFTTAPGWSLISSDTGLAALERGGASALMSVASAPLDSSWNSPTYKRSVLSAAARFAGDIAFDDMLEIASQEMGVYTLEIYDSSVTVPDGTAAVNMTALLTLDNHAFTVFQLTAARSTYTPAMRDEVLQMALSAIKQ